MNPEPLNCLQCGKPFKQCRNKTKRFCCEKCRSKYYFKNYYGDNKQLIIDNVKERERKLYGVEEEFTHKKRIRALTNFHYIKRGICMVCGKISETDFHHGNSDSISRIYNIKEVIEVCKECHQKIHHH